MRKHYPLDPTTGAENAALLPWSDGVPATGTQGSYPGQALVTDQEAELLNAIAATTQSASGSDLTQLTQAIAIGLYLGTVTGTANAITAALPGSVPIPALFPGMRFHTIVASTNTQPVTLTLTGFAQVPGAKPARRSDGVTELAPGDLRSGTLATWFWDGTAFRLVGSSKSDNLGLIQSVTRINLTGNLLLYVRNDTVAGSTPTGLTNTTTDAFANIQAAITYAFATYNLAGFTLTIQLGVSGSYAGYAVPNVGVVGQVVVQGSAVSPANFVVLPAQQSDGSYVCLGSYIPTVSGYGLTLDMSSVTVGAAARAFSGGQLALGKIVLKYTGSSQSVSMMQEDAGGIISRFDDVSVTGGGTLNAISYANGGIDAGCTNAAGRALACNGMTFNAFYLVARGGQATDQFTTFSGSGNVGPRYALSLDGVLNSANPALIPGSLPGTEADGGTVTGGTAWTAATLTLAAQSGALGSAVAAARYKKVGKVVFLQFVVSIASAGSGAGSLSVSLPFTSVGEMTAIGRETTNTGKAVTASGGAGATVLTLQYYDNTTCIASGNRIAVLLAYEAA